MFISSHLKLLTFEYSFRFREVLDLRGSRMLYIEKNVSARKLTVAVELKQNAEYREIIFTKTILETKENHKLCSNSNENTLFFCTMESNVSLYEAKLKFYFVATEGGNLTNSMQCAREVIEYKIVIDDFLIDYPFEIFLFCRNYVSMCNQTIYSM